MEGGMVASCSSVIPRMTSASWWRLRLRWAPLKLHWVSVIWWVKLTYYTYYIFNFVSPYNLLSGSSSRADHRRRRGSPQSELHTPWHWKMLLEVRSLLQTVQQSQSEMSDWTIYPSPSVTLPVNILRFRIYFCAHSNSVSPLSPCSVCHCFKVCLSTTERESIMKIPYNKNCLYEFQSKVTMTYSITPLFSDFSETVSYGNRPSGFNTSHCFFLGTLEPELEQCEVVASHLKLISHLYK